MTRCSGCLNGSFLAPESRSLRPACGGRAEEPLHLLAVASIAVGSGLGAGCAEAFKFRTVEAQSDTSRSRYARSAR
jgi:hypothetical protein